MQTIKKFLEWIKLKIALHEKKNAPSFEERETWWTNVGENIGMEISGIETSALLSQARVISSKRLIRKIDKIGSNSFRELKIALRKAILE
jgi:hypothetical protein